MILVASKGGVELEVGDTCLGLLLMMDEDLLFHSPEMGQIGLHKKVCVCVCSCVIYVHVEARSQLRSSPTTSPYFSLSLVQLGWPASSRGSHGSLPPSADYRSSWLQPAFYRDAGDLNSDPHTFMARILLIEPSPQSSFSRK